jgi:acyl-CoA thioesterase FadM
MNFRFEIWRDEPTASPSPLITADLVYVNVEVAAAKPAPLPGGLRDRIRAYERIAPADS